MPSTNCTSCFRPHLLARLRWPALIALMMSLALLGLQLSGSTARAAGTTQSYMIAPFDTTWQIYIKNTSASQPTQVMVTLIPFGGGATPSTQVFILPNALSIVSPASFGGYNPNSAYTVKLSATPVAIESVMLNRQPPSSAPLPVGTNQDSLAAVMGFENSATSFILASAVENGNIFLANQGNNPAQGNIVYYNQFGQQISPFIGLNIFPQNGTSINLSSPLPTTEFAWAQVSVDQPLHGLLHQASSATRFYELEEALSPATTLFLPRVFVPNNPSLPTLPPSTTKLLVINPNNAVASVTLTFYQSNGVSQGPIFRTVGPKQTSIIDLSGFFGPGLYAAVVQSNQPIVVTEQPTSGIFNSNFTGFATYKTGMTASEAQTELHLPRLIRQVDTVFFKYSTLNLQTTSSTNASVNVQFFNQYGQPVHSQSLTIPGFSSGLIDLDMMVSSLGNDFEGSALVISTQPLLAWVDEYQGYLGTSLHKTDTLVGDVNGNGLVDPGDVLEYTITLTNYDDKYDLAATVVLSDTPDLNTTLITGTVSTTQGTIDEGNGAGDTAVSVNVGSLADNTTATITFQASLNDPLPNGVTQVSNQATVWWDAYQWQTDDPEGGTIFADPTVTEIQQINQPSLTIDKTVTPASSQPGQTITYTIVVENSGLGEAKGAVISDTLPAGLTFVGPVTIQGGSGSPGNAGTLPTLANGLTIGAGQSVTVTFPVLVGAGVANGTLITNTAAVTSSEISLPVTDSQVIIINNQAPSANAGNDQTVTGGSGVTLDGGGSTDPEDHLPLSFGWVQTGGPVVTLSDPSLAQPIFTAPAGPTMLTFSLTVTDVFGAVDPTPDEVVITVAGSPSSSSQFQYFPLLIKSFGLAPDLQIESLSVSSSGVTVVIINTGDAPVSDAFWVDLYVNPDQTPALNQEWEIIAPAGLVWGVAKTLNPGERLTLTENSPYFFPSLSSPLPLPVGAQVYALVDSINYDTNYGAVQESNEANNLFGPVLSAAASTQTPAAAAGIEPSRQGLPAR